MGLVILYILLVILISSIVSIIVKTKNFEDYLIWFTTSIGIAIIANFISLVIVAHIFSKIHGI